MEIKLTKQFGIFPQLLKKVICAYFLLIILLLSIFQFLLRNEIYDIICPLMWCHTFSQVGFQNSFSLRYSPDCLKLPLKTSRDTALVHGNSLMEDQKAVIFTVMYFAIFLPLCG